MYRWTVRGADEVIVVDTLPLLPFHGSSARPQKLTKPCFASFYQYAKVVYSKYLLIDGMICRQSSILVLPQNPPKTPHGLRHSFFCFGKYNGLTSAPPSAETLTNLGTKNRPWRSLKVLLQQIFRSLGVRLPTATYQCGDD